MKIQATESGFVVVHPVEGALLTFADRRDAVQFVKSVRGER